jgi:predicted nucleic acid-binding protein
VLAELAYLLTRQGGTDRELALLAEVEREAYALASFEALDVAAVARVIERHRDLGIGLTDASLVVLAARVGTKRLFTLDERRFRALTPLDGSAFELLPADA